MSIKFARVKNDRFSGKNSKSCIFRLCFLFQDKKREVEFFDHESSWSSEFVLSPLVGKRSITNNYFTITSCSLVKTFWQSLSVICLHFFKLLQQFHHVLNNFIF